MDATEESSTHHRASCSYSSLQSPEETRARQLAGDHVHRRHRPEKAEQREGRLSQRRLHRASETMEDLAPTSARSQEATSCLRR